jgi:hypothetical protein
MKKLLYIFFLSGFLFMYFSTTPSKVSKIKSGWKLVKSSANIPGEHKSEGLSKKDESEKQKSPTNVSSILPAYFWDTKMITW